MYKLGYLSPDQQIDQDNFETYQSYFKEELYELHKINNTNESDIDHLDGLILEDSLSQDIGQVCKTIIELRKNSDIILWVVSSQTVAKTTRIIYLQLGADGIMDQATDWDESELLIKNALTRVKKQDIVLPVLPTSKMTDGEYDSYLQLIPQNLSIRVENGQEVELTKLEYMAIEYLYRHVKTTVTYDEIYKNLWKEDCNNRKYRVSNLIFHLRKKIETADSGTRYIKTIRSRGYMLIV